MKKVISILLISVLFILTLNINGASVVAAANQSVNIALDGMVLVFPDAQPFVDSNNRTLAPARFIAEALGSKVTWDDTSNAATVTKGSTTIIIVIGKSFISVNSAEVKMDTTAVSKDGRIFIPVRYVAEALGSSVSFNNDLQRVEITSTALNIPNTTIDYSSRISAGENYCMAILDDNTLWGWGDDNGVHLGLRFSDKKFVYKPAKIMDNAKAVFSGWGTTLAIKTDNTLWAWGDNMPGVGEDRLTFSLIPMKIMDNVVSAASCKWSVFAVDSNGTLWGWGDNDGTVLNAKWLFKDNKNHDFYRPIVLPVKLMDGVKKVAAYGSAYCVLKKDGTLLYYGQYLGGEDSEGKNKLTTGQELSILSTGVKDMSMVDDTAYFVKSDDSLWGIGKAAHDYQEDIDESTPAKIMDNMKAVSISATLPPFAVKKDGTLLVWGSIGNGVYIDLLFGKKYGGSLDLNNLKPREPAVLMKDVREVGAGQFQYLIQKNDGSVWTWGFNENGGVGDGSASSDLMNSQMVKLEFSNSEEQLFSANPQKSKYLSDWIKENEAAGNIPAYDAGFKADWSGNWDHMLLNLSRIEQSGNSVAGYTLFGGLVMVGTVDGNKLRGNTREGIFELTMLTDGISYSGLHYLNSAAEPEVWHGTKIN